MRKLLNNPWIVAVLALLAVAFVGFSLWPKSQRHDSAESVSANVVPVEDSAEPATLNNGQAMTIDEALKAIALTSIPADPFAPRTTLVSESVTQPTAAPDVVETMKLSAIWTQEGKTFVLVNGQIHQPGDEISRIKIESATQDGMWIGHAKGRSFVTLGADFTVVIPAKVELRTARL